MVALVSPELGFAGGMSWCHKMREKPVKKIKPKPAKVGFVYHLEEAPKASLSQPGNSEGKKENERERKN